MTRFSPLVPQWKAIENYWPMVYENQKEEAKQAKNRSGCSAVLCPVGMRSEHEDEKIRIGQIQENVDRGFAASSTRNACAIAHKEG